MFSLRIDRADLTSEWPIVMRGTNGVSKASYHWSQFIEQSAHYRLYPVSECDTVIVCP